MSLFNEKRETLLKDCIMSLETCINIIKGHSENKESDLEIMKSITKDICLLEEDFQNSPEVLANSTEETSDFESNCEFSPPTAQELEICKKHNIWKRIVQNLIDNSNNEDGNEDEDINNIDETLIFSTSFTIPSDPISKCYIKNPAVNTVCKHVYENDTIQDYIKAKTKKKKKHIRCPYVGCVNDKLKASDLELDDALRLKIADKISKIETPKSKSFIDISM